MSIEIKQHRGYRLIDGKEEWFDLPQDEIFLTGKEYPVAKSVGYVAREAGAVVALHLPVSEADMAEILKAVAAREFDGVEKRKVSVAPPIGEPTGKGRK